MATAGPMGSELPMHVLATTLLVASVVIGRLRPNWPIWFKLLWRYGIFAVLTIIVQRVLGSPLHPHFSLPYSGTSFWDHVIEAGWWFLAAGVAISIIRIVVVLEHRPRETQMVSDLIAGGITIATLLAIVNFVLGVPIAGLLATSGVIAIVLGLASQNTLADVFSGIAVGLERPYKAGDLLWIEGGIEGHVTQVNWRSTQIVTGHGNIAIVPNSVIAKARLINRSLPVSTRGDTLDIKLDPAVPPDQAMAVLQAATQAALLPLAVPAPSVSCTGLHLDSVSYAISYSVSTSSMLGTARTELWSQIHRHLRHANIAFAVAPAAERPISTGTPDLIELLAQSDLFGVLSEADRKLLAQGFTQASLETGEALLEQGGSPVYLFLIASGVVEITRSTPAGPHLLRRMSPGESLGAIGLITNTPYAATATAITPVHVFRMDKAAIATAIATAPGLAAGLEDLAHRSQAAIERDMAANQAPGPQPPDELRIKLRNFLRLLSA
ncbi:mechanosensitive ion channel family protein [Acidisoma cellulosilytica]|uniref:Small-conductance mechanosensitive channel n=1 Tax=Acidisoma cellulosilyticum TaxID=2802395 RepID=A0A963Z424_9PROT|nr:mechanosensitive ion channel family protein [Acidisoma cellulosilyticum]MCB8882505.1 mechanosensitive ion channel family protein [Acidisoma cellulosilyticum]